MCIYIYITIII